MANFNISRLTEDVKREISAALPAIKDKHVSGEIVSISRVEITNDLSYCKVYVSALGGAKKSEAAAKALEKAAGFIVRRINSAIKMRKMPRLIFIADDSQEYYEKISGIIDSLKTEGSIPDADSADEADANSADRADADSADEADALDYDEDEIEDIDDIGDIDADDYE